jgi:hypothetical protein
MLSLASKMFMYYFTGIRVLKAFHEESEKNNFGQKELSPLYKEGRSVVDHDLH